MLRVALVTILARELRLKFVQVDQRLEMLRVPLVTILMREMCNNYFYYNPFCSFISITLDTLVKFWKDW